MRFGINVGCCSQRDRVAIGDIRAATVGTTTGRPYGEIQMLRGGRDMISTFRTTGEISPKGRCREATEGCRLRLRNVPAKVDVQNTSGGFCKQKKQAAPAFKVMHFTLFYSVSSLRMT